MIGTPNPTFNFVHEIPLAVTSDLDRYLRTSKVLIHSTSVVVEVKAAKHWNMQMHLLVLDEADSPITDGDYCYGVASISLAPLALGDGVRGEFEVVDSKGKGAGRVEVEMRWERPYRLDVVPVSIFGVCCFLGRRWWWLIFGVGCVAVGSGGCWKGD